MNTLSILLFLIIDFNFGVLFISPTINYILLSFINFFNFNFR